MPKTNKINRNYFIERKVQIIVAFAYLIATLAIYFLDFGFWALIPAFFFVAFTADLIRDKKFHKIFIHWLDKNPNAKIFIYSSKKQDVEIIEGALLSTFQDNILVVKNDNAKITGDITRTIYFQLHQLMTIKDLPLLISFTNDEWSKKSLKEYFDRYKSKNINQAELLEYVSEALHKA